MPKLRPESGRASGTWRVGVNAHQTGWAVRRGERTASSRSTGGAGRVGLEKEGPARLASFLPPEGSGMVIAGCTQGTQDGGDVLRNKAVGGTGEHPESGASGEDARKQSGQLWPSGWGGTGQRLSRRGGLPGLPHSWFSFFFFFKAQVYLSPSKGSSAFLTAGNRHLSLSLKAISAPGEWIVQWKERQTVSECSLFHSANLAPKPRTALMRHCILPSDLLPRWKSFSQLNKWLFFATLSWKNIKDIRHSL